MDARWDPRTPHNALPLLPPRADLETRPVLKLCVEARAALTELRVSAEMIPNPAVLINTLPLLEAQASSEIENIVTSADELFRHARSDDSGDAATREALRYRDALMKAFAELESRPISTRSAERICSQIKGTEMTVRRSAGTRIVNLGTGATIHTPPEGEEQLRGLLANWEAFLHDAGGDDSLDPLVRLAVQHYQFEAIHPFTDGNGRTGRVINNLLLVEQGLLAQPILYLSRYIIRHRADYYRLLLGVTRDGAWEEWIRYILRGIEETARWTTAKVAAMRQLARAEGAYLKSAHRSLYDRDLLDVIFEQPYCRIGNLVERGIGTRQLASRRLHGLVDAGVLRAETAGREKLFVHTRLMALLTKESNEFAPL
jgi:Fic family protein